MGGETFFGWGSGICCWGFGSGSDPQTSWIRPSSTMLQVFMAPARSACE